MTILHFISSDGSLTCDDHPWLTPLGYAAEVEVQERFALTLKENMDGFIYMGELIEKKTGEGKVYM